MRKIETIFKMIFIFGSVPLFILINVFFGINNAFYYNLINQFILTSVVIDILLIIDFINNRDYRKYKIENPDKFKINWFILFLITFSVFALPYFLFHRLINIIDMIMWKAGMITLYVLFTFFYANFIYKLVKEYNKLGKTGSPLRRIRQYSYLELMSYQINKISFYNKIMIFENRLFIISESGIFEIIDINKKGKLTGNIKDDKWHFNNKEVKNPFILFGEYTYHYFISSNDIVFDVFGVGIIGKNNLVNLLEKYANKKVFNKDEVNDIYTNLEVKYGCYQNKIY